MTNHRTNRLIFTIILTALSTASAAAFADGGHDHAQIGKAVHAHVDPTQCRYARADGRRGVTADEARKMLRCAQARWPVAGGLTKLFSVVGCESHFDEAAQNPTTSAGGLFQFLASTWDGLRGHAREIGRRWSLSWSRFNARASAVLGTRLIHQSGYGPWEVGSCA